MKVGKIEMVLYISLVTSGTIAKIYEAVDKWDESKLIWNNQPGYFGLSVVTQLQTDLNNTKYKFDVTNLADEWLEQGAEWPGVVLQSGTLNQATEFYSPKAQNASLRPIFNVYYTMN